MTLQVVLLKLSGQACSNSELIRHLAHQIKQLSRTQLFGIVIGGGNFFRGSQQGKQLGMSSLAGHQVGIMATLLNGLILEDLFYQEGLETRIFSAIDCPTAGQSPAPSEIRTAIHERICMIFTGGTGSPYFTTDTNALVRALQIGAQEVWKATDVVGIYDKDPKKYNDAQLLSHVNYHYALHNKLGIVDSTALVMAQEHTIPIRVFSMYEPNSLMHAASNASYGSVINIGIRQE